MRSLLSLVTDARRSHALEHATIQVLQRRRPWLAMLGRSTPGGFYIYGDVPTTEVQEAVVEALSRLRRGERRLAVHARCGTNLITTGVLIGAVAFLTMLPGDDRSRRGRLPLVLLLSTLAAIVAQPLGPLVQEHITTQADLGTTDVVGVERHEIGNLTVHKVLLRHGM